MLYRPFGPRIIKNNREIINIKTEVLTIKGPSMYAMELPIQRLIFVAIKAYKFREN
jgi:hypothetical protein